MSHVLNSEQRVSLASTFTERQFLSWCSSNKRDLIDLVRHEVEGNLLERGFLRAIRSAKLETVAHLHQICQKDLQLYRKTTRDFGEMASVSPRLGTILRTASTRPHIFWWILDQFVSNGISLEIILRDHADYNPVFQLVHQRWPDRLRAAEMDQVCLPEWGWLWCTSKINADDLVAFLEKEIRSVSPKLKRSQCFWLAKRSDLDVDEVTRLVKLTFERGHVCLMVVIIDCFGLDLYRSDGELFAHFLEIACDENLGTYSRRCSRREMFVELVKWYHYDLTAGNHRIMRSIHKSYEWPYEWSREFRKLMPGGDVQHLFMDIKGEPVIDTEGDLYLPMLEDRSPAIVSTYRLHLEGYFEAMIDGYYLYTVAKISVTENNQLAVGNSAALIAWTNPQPMMELTLCEDGETTTISVPRASFWEEYLEHAPIRVCKKPAGAVRK